MLNDYGAVSLPAFSFLTERQVVETSEAVFQLRPFKDFLPSKGRDKLMSLSYLTRMPDDQAEVDVRDRGSDASDSGATSRSRNAYNFMRSRGVADGDPTTIRWDAAVRLANFTNVDNAPLCVGRTFVIPS